MRAKGRLQWTGTSTRRYHHLPLASPSASPNWPSGYTLEFEVKVRSIKGQLGLEARFHKRLVCSSLEMLAHRRTNCQIGGVLPLLQAVRAISNLIRHV